MVAPLWGGGNLASDTILSRTDRNVTTQVAPRSVREARLKINMRWGQQWSGTLLGVVPPGPHPP